MKTKNEIVIKALEAALYLLNDEIQCVELESLREQYSEVIKKLEDALKFYQEC